MWGSTGKSHGEPLLLGGLERTPQACCSWGPGRDDPAMGWGIGDPERLFQGYLLFLWKMLSFSMA